MREVVEDIGDRHRALPLDKGLDIPELLAATDEGLSQAEIAKALHLTSNEIYRMLDRQAPRQSVARTAGDGYELTLKPFAVAHQHAPVRRQISQAMPEHWSSEGLRPFVEHGIAVFRWERLVWGSNWPVCTLTAGLTRWVATTHVLLGGTSADETAQLLPVNAAHFYRLA